MNGQGPPPGGGQKQVKQINAIRHDDNALQLISNYKNSVDPNFNYRLYKTENGNFINADEMPGQLRDLLLNQNGNNGMNGSMNYENNNNNNPMMPNGQYNNFNGNNGFHHMNGGGGGMNDGNENDLPPTPPDQSSMQQNQHQGPPPPPPPVHINNGPPRPQQQIQKLRKRYQKNINFKNIDLTFS